jgi:hypothetical protein
MPTITSFRSSAVESEDLSGIMADYLALERARIFRRFLAPDDVDHLGPVGDLLP